MAFPSLSWLLAGAAAVGVVAAVAWAWTLQRRLTDKADQLEQLKMQLLEWNRKLEERVTDRTRDLEISQGQLEQSYLETVTSLLEAMSAKDTYLYGHSHSVASYASSIAKELGFSGERIRRLVYGCELHDLGKIAVPDSILMKAGPLTKEEFEIIKTHPTWGARILHPITSMKDITEMVHQEHERWDGTGYPQGLKGNRIRLEARIIAVADALDAMISRRPYRQSVTIQKASEELSRCAGSHFDPDVVDACLRAIQTGRLVPMPEAPHPHAAIHHTARFGQGH